MHYLKMIHDIFFFMKIHDYLFLIFNLVHHKIKNKTFGIYVRINVAQMIFKVYFIEYIFIYLVKY